MSTAYHPQTERENRTLETVLRARVNFDQDDWGEHRLLAELALNAAPQASSGYSPFFLNHGQEPLLPFDLALGTSRSADGSENPAAEERLRRMRSALDRARSNIESAQQRQKRLADRGRRALRLVVGDLVLLSTANLQLAGTRSKLSAPYAGPFRVARVVNENAYELELPPTLPIHPVINVDRLKPYRDGSSAFPDRPPPHARPPPVTTQDNGAPAYEVERVLARRGRGRGLQYLVLWRGYPMEEATWEPANHLADAPGAVTAFNRL